MRSWFYETPICLQSKELDLRFTVNKEVIVLMQASLKNSWTVIWTIFTTSTLPKSIKMTFMLYGEGTFMTLRTRTVCLKTGAVLQTVSKDCSYFIWDVWEPNYKWVLTILHEATTMTGWTRMVCLKTGAVLQIVSKYSNYFMRRVCFQEWHIIVQYVRYGEIILA